MSDFFQHGPVATLHRLRSGDVARLEAELCEFARLRPISLVLPCHAEEIGSAALAHIVSELAGVPYLDEIVVGIDGADRQTWERAMETFSPLGERAVLLWNDGPRLAALLGELREGGFSSGAPGKGRNLWLCIGRVIASGRARVIAAHDCDILTYDRELLARLCYPPAHPSLGFDFAKGYSARFSDRLHGRVMRLFLTPLLRSLKNVCGGDDLVEFLSGFRYPLSGEICLDADLAKRIRVPHDWGVDVGILTEVFRLCAARAICQTDVAGRYDHKHRELSARDPSRGLNRMAADIARRLFHSLAARGVRLDRAALESLVPAYAAAAADSLHAYAADAGINGLDYHRSDEDFAVQTFVGSLQKAASAFLSEPLCDPLLPEWNLVQASLPSFLRDLSAAIAADRREVSTRRTSDVR